MEIPVSSGWSSVWVQVASGDTEPHRSTPEARIQGFRRALGTLRHLSRSLQRCNVFFPAG